MRVARPAPVPEGWVASLPVVSPGGASPSPGGAAHGKLHFRASGGVRRPGSGRPGGGGAGGVSVRVGSMEVWMGGLCGGSMGV